MNVSVFIISLPIFSFPIGSAYTLPSPATGSPFHRVPSAFQPFFAIPSHHQPLIPSGSSSIHQSPFDLHHRDHEQGVNGRPVVHHDVRDLYRYHKILAQGPYASIQHLRTPNVLMTPYV